MDIIFFKQEGYILIKVTPKQILLLYFCSLNKNVNKNEQSNLHSN